MSADKHMSKASARPIDPRSPLADAAEAQSALNEYRSPGGMAQSWEQYDKAYRKEERAQHLLNTDTYCAGE